MRTVHHVIIHARHFFARPYYRRRVPAPYSFGVPNAINREKRLARKDNYTATSDWTNAVMSGEYGEADRYRTRDILAWVQRRRRMV